VANPASAAVAAKAGFAEIERVTSDPAIHAGTGLDVVREFRP
jgi:hypothetical protein